MLWWWRRWDATANGLQIEQIYNYILRIRFCYWLSQRKWFTIFCFCTRMHAYARTRIAFQRKIDSGVSISTSIINVNHRYYRTIMVFFFSTKLTVHLTISYLKCENKTKQNNKEKRKETKSKNSTESWAWIEFWRGKMRVFSKLQPKNRCGSSRAIGEGKMEFRKTIQKGQNFLNDMWRCEHS